ncbi:MAG TPA: hypothetical protein VMO47_05505 [Rhodothermales bacterium]|nr:hypothetical protein [Rhodothermales bacterium]
MLEDKPSGPIAASTVDIDWSPLRGGGANFRTHRLVPVDLETTVFKPTVGALVFYFAFMLFGVIPSAIGFWQLVSEGFHWQKEILIPFGFGAVFGTIGFALFAFGSRPIVFDKNRGYYWKGRKDPDAVWSKEELKHFAELKDVHGLQIVSEWVKSDKSSYASYELNLVLKDGSRMNVVDHGNETKLREDAEVLAGFLGVPLIEK